MAFANLSNHILATKASKALARLKSRHRDLFQSPSLYYRVLEMLSSYHYRLAVRRYVLELFEIPLDDRAAQAISMAGEELIARKEEEEEAAANGVGGAEGRGGTKWALPTGGDALLEGIEGDFTDDDDESVEEGTAAIPLQVLQPMITIRGFLIS